MPPLTQPQVVGWLLLFVPGFVALCLMSWLGWPATRRSQLHWLAYALLISLFCELIVRGTVDRALPSWVDPVSHPVRRALVLLVPAITLGLSLGLLQHDWRFNRWIWRLLKESALPTVWLAYFRNPKTTEWVMVETVNGTRFIAHVESYSIDPGDSNQELVLTNVMVKIDDHWSAMLGPVYLNGKQIAFVVASQDPDPSVLAYGHKQNGAAGLTVSAQTN